MTLGVDGKLARRAPENKPARLLVIFIGTIVGG
jgi:hypothetical protein